MWKGPTMDPGEPEDGGTPSNPPPGSKELSDLKDQYEQQQVLIAQLKEMLRRSEQANVTQEKVEEYANTLTKMNAKAKSSILRRSTGNESLTETKKFAIDSPAKEKITLLRQQMEENKAKLAERGKMVSQLKAQLDDSQQIISQTSLLPCDVKSDSYSIHSSSEDLFNIILSKEKHINDLTAKVQKLEANVLDLQENLKEKDQVIDARTKAITLMSESLSKKGKNTLEALDDTKEQMRKMQENFIHLETEMKAEKQKLLEEIVKKNQTIESLKEVNKKQEETIFELKLNNSELQDKLEQQTILVEKYKNELTNNENSPFANTEDYKKQIETLNNRIKELESSQKSPKKSKKPPAGEIDQLQKMLKETKDENNILISQKLELENKIKELDTAVSELQSSKMSSLETNTENEEIAKLKKQLDESNKNMIKAKAQHKSKLKELTKKIDAFKKISDSNAEIVRLQNENSKLSQKIAELEEEKGNLQLKICETDSLTDSVNAEHLKELEEEISKLNKTIEEKNDSISSLTQEIESCRSEINLLTEQLAGLKHLQNTQVTTEITSIHFEEQLDKIESEKKQILEDKESLQKENMALLDLNEQLKKEKQEISAKLDNYMQENIELIDKLEKLSVEKVSSAESIEIVESLTQQEKLELEAYQKSLDLVSGNIKNSDENLEQNPELNESVNQLTEETSELLQKIELFTLERREVMEKMETLTNENNNLSVRLKEIENNRDTLIETYETLQNEKEILSNKLETLVLEKQELQKTIEYLDYENVKLREKLDGSADDEKENEAFREKMKENEELSKEKQKLEDELNVAKKQLFDLETSLNEKVTEIENYRSILKDLENELKSKQTKFEEDVAYLNSVINKQNLELSQTENTNKAEFLTELECVKKALKDNLMDMEASQKELQASSVTISNLSTELDNLKRKISETEYLLESKDDEIKKLLKDRDNKEIVIENLQKELKYNSENFHKICNELKEKCFTLQHQIEQNSDSISNIREPLEAKIEELTNKNKEQLEKMKKLAANLKKKTQAYQELEEKHAEINEKWENESKEKNVIIENQQMTIKESEEKIQSLLEQLQEVELEFSKVQADYKTKLQEYENIKSKTAISDQLENKLSEQEKKIASLVEENQLLQKNVQEASIAVTSLNNEIESLQLASEKNLSVLNNKIENLEMLTETQEESLSQYREEIDSLRKKLASTEEAKLSLEKEKAILEENMNKACTYYESASNDASSLKARLEELQNIEEQLQKTLIENKELIENNQRLNDKNGEFKQQIEILNQSLDKLSSENLRIDNENLQLQKVINELKQELNKNTTLVSEKTKELEKLDSDMQEELIKESDERKNLTTQVELLSDQLKECIMTNEVLKGEILEYKEKLVQQQNEFEQTFVSTHTLEAQNNNYLLQIQELNEKLIAFTNNESEKIENLLEEKNSLKNQLDMQNSQISQINAEFEATKLELSAAKEELKLVKDKLEEYEDSSRNLIQNVAHDTVDKVITDAAQKLEINETISTFVWPQSEKESIFDDLIVKEETHSVKTEVPLQIPSENRTDTEELLKKIKTLEFMLYSVEKEKDDALLQCHEMSNELTRLIYERENIKKESPLEKQIVQPQDIVTESDGNYDQLCHFQFAEAKPIVKRDANFEEPISEDVIQPKSAYLCYNPDTSKGTSDQPINLDTFGENDDGWGCGSEEAKLEEAHRKTSESYSMKLLADQYDEKIRALELERQRHLEEIKQSQIKSGKLIKKLKEFKVRNEQLEAKLKMNADDSLNLDDAIQDELKTQIKTLENQLSENKTELEKVKADRDRLSKKVEVLTSANERMMEMKEKQDVELLYWQQKNRELNSKFEQFEWGGDNTESPKKLAVSDSASHDKGSDQHLQSKIEELNETIKDLMLDNEELQTMLEEQRNIRISLEKSKSVEPISENMKPESEFLQLQTECNNLREELANKAKETARLQNELTMYQQKENEVQGQLASFNQQCEVLKQQNYELNNKLQHLQQEYENTNIKSATNDDLQSSLNTLKEENFTLREAFNKLQLELENLRSRNDQLLEVENQIYHISEEKNTLFTELQKKNAQLNDVKNTLEEKSKEIENLMAENQLLKENLSKKDIEIELKLTATAEQLALEWAERVDQRGSDVAESWKLHLESRENEFVQIEQHLQKQINEMEEKYNTLVNENNELRKNVDAEIRNEVDRISALQQQIYDKQQSVNELMKNVQEKQEEVNKLNQTLMQYEMVIQEKDRRIVELELAMKEIENSSSFKDAQINEITAKFEETRTECNKLRQDLEDSKLTVSTLNNSLEEYKFKLDEHQDSQNKLQQKLHESDSVINQLKQQIEELQLQNSNIDIVHKQLTEYQNMVTEKQSQIDQLNRDLTNYQNINEVLQMKESEINQLRYVIDEKEKEFSYNLEMCTREDKNVINEQIQELDSLKRRLVEVENHYEELVAAKDADLENLRLQLKQQIEKSDDVFKNNEEIYQNLQSQLLMKTNECQELHVKLNEQNVLQEEENKQLIELRGIIEEQVIKIEELKKELYEKSNDYDALIAQFDIRRSPQQETAKAVETTSRQPVVQEENLAEPVSRAELDLALYMLHQRDVRCEELTVELMQLLEERDTLQLKLSNALREKEEIRNLVEPKSSGTSSSKDSAVVSSEISEAKPETAEIQNPDSLANKLSELKTVGYRKDKTLVDDQELRRLQELSIMQQHRDVAAKLPPEAAARLVDASYTLSRDVQSPSKVLLNWLWGRSIPKVNNV